MTTNQPPQKVSPVKPAILCVDDEPIILEVLKHQLKDHFGTSMAYEMAQDGEEGLDVIEELTQQGVEIVVIVSDWMMPGMNGGEFLEKVYQKFPDTGLIILTGHADQDTLQKTLQQIPIKQCMSKPWTEEQLIAAVESALDKP